MHAARFHLASYSRVFNLLRAVSVCTSVYIYIFIHLQFHFWNGTVATVVVAQSLCFRSFQRVRAYACVCVCVCAGVYASRFIAVANHFNGWPIRIGRYSHEPTGCSIPNQIHLVRCMNVRPKAGVKMKNILFSLSL